MRTILVCLTLLTLVVVPLVVDGGPRSEPVSAGTAVRFELEELAREAELIVEGQVLRTHGVRRAGRIETEVLLAVERTHAGRDEALRWITLPGGVLPSGDGLLLAGMPRLAVGERVVLFLSAANSLDVRVPVGLAQGKWSVLRATDGRRWVRQAPAARGVLVDGPPSERALDYADFLARVTAGRRHARR